MEKMMMMMMMILLRRKYDITEQEANGDIRGDKGNEKST